MVSQPGQGPILPGSAHYKGREKGERSVPPQDFTPDDLPAATVPIYPGLGLAHDVNFMHCMNVHTAESSGHPFNIYIGCIL